MAVNLRIETEQEEDGRWIAEIRDLPGVMVYADSRDEAVARVKALALRALADRLENGEAVPQTADFSQVPRTQQSVGGRVASPSPQAD